MTALTRCSLWKTWEIQLTQIANAPETRTSWTTASPTTNDGSRPVRPLTSLSRATKGQYVKTQKERADDKRKEKLEQMQEQLDAGTLKVRKMTAKERAANPPRARPERGRRR
jgi:hypothetical protein